MTAQHKFRTRFAAYGFIFLLALAIFLTIGFSQEDAVNAISLEATPVPPDLSPVVQNVLPSIVLDGPSITPDLKVGEKSSLDFSVTGVLLPGCFGVPQKPVDAVVVIDTSPSAGKPAEGSNFWQSEQILKSLWAQMDQPVCTAPSPENCELSRLGIVTIDIGTKGVEIVSRLPLTSTAGAINTTVDGLETGADSSFDLGIKHAVKTLNKEGRSDAEKIIVLLMHDGFFASDETVIDAAKQAGSEYPLFVIGNTLNLREAEKITEEEAEKLTSPSNIFINPSAADLRRLFVKSSGGDENVVGRGVRIGAAISPSGGVNLWSDDGKIDHGHITWQLPEVQADERQDFQADIKVQDDQSASELAIAGELSYLDCNGLISVGGPLEKRFSVGKEAQQPETPPPTKTIPPPSDNSSSGGNSQTNEGGGNNGGSSRTLPRISWKIILPLLLLLILALIYFALCNAHILPWCKSKSRPKAIGGARPIKDEEKPEVKWRPPEKDGGSDIIPGQKADDEALRNKLLNATSIVGRIPTNKTGRMHSPVVVEVFSSANEMWKSSFDLMKMAHYAKGDQKFNYFVWSTDAGEVEAPITLLNEVLQKRISPDTPLIVFWTPKPTDNSEFRIKVSPTPHGITISGTRKYRPQRAGANPKQSFFISMKFIHNKQRMRIDKGPIIDN